ncbi:MAG: UDP-N-acetylglucosamine--N-acetylmuramyl-(pentapeptide) pyrophosphoryl-undecaprenol N-acetylglucosamine transferase [Actinomycetota bacterium]
MKHPGVLCLRGGLIIAGGGTAGHLLPGLAVADELVKRGWDKEAIGFVGSARGIEVEMVPTAGYALRALSGRGLNGRRVSIQNFWNLLTILWGVLRGISIVARHRPGIVLSLGGYAALPAAVGAIILRIPLVLAEQNLVASGVNRLLTRYARAAAVPHFGTGLRNEVETGNPVRESVIEASQLGRASRSELGWPSDEPVVVVFGGSLGSRRINEALWQAVEVSDLPMVHHVVGQRDWLMLPKDLPLTVRAIEYDEELPKAMAAADLIVCRPGGSTVAEIALLGVPAILVPLPHAPNNHQRRNAEWLVDSGLAVVVNDEELDGKRIATEIRGMLDGFHGEDDPELARQARSIGPRDATRRVADLVVDHCLIPAPTNHRKDGTL